MKNQVSKSLIIFTSMLVIGFVFFSCNSTIEINTQNNLYNQKAIEFNEKGVKYTMMNQNDSALYFYDMAIEIDETYYLPHSNKIQIYVSDKDYENALIESQFVVSKNPDLAEGWLFHGMITEWLGDSISAKEYYIHSIELFDKRIKSTNDYTDANKLNRAIAYIFIGEKDKGMKDLKELAEKDKFYEDFLNVSKKEYLIDILDSKPLEVKKEIIIDNDTLKIKESSFKN